MEYFLSFNCLYTDFISQINTFGPNRRTSAKFGNFPRNETRYLYPNKI